MVHGQRLGAHLRTAVVADAGYDCLDPDAALMLRVKQGDTDAFTQLVEKYKQPVMNLAYRSLRDQTEAFRKAPPPEARALAVFCQALLSSNRFLYVD